MTKRRVDRTGRAQYLRKPTQAEIDRRTGWVAKLHRKGHSAVEIAEALDVGRETVSKALRDLGLNTTRRVNGMGRVTYACPWRDEDVPPEDRFPTITGEARTTRWRQSRIVGMAQMLNDEYRESNFANILANQVTDAEESGDTSWTLEALATFNAAIEKLERARRVLTDDDYRVACRDTLEGVEAMRLKHPPLRAVSP